MLSILIGIALIISFVVTPYIKVPSEHKVDIKCTDRTVHACSDEGLACPLTEYFDKI